MRCCHQHSSTDRRPEPSRSGRCPSRARSLALISTSFDEKSRGQAIGTWSGFTAITTAIGPVLGGYPILAALGFVLFAVPSIAAGYWSAFFPAVLVLGCGMAVTVAPLTTVVMSSVSQDRVGTASGVNNAIARVAGVVAIAVFGIVMVNAFISHLNRSLDHLSLPPGVRQQVQAEDTKLAGLPLPAGLDSGARAALKESVREVFCIWIPPSHVDLRRLVRGQCRGCLAHGDGVFRLGALARIIHELSGSHSSAA